MTTDHPAASTTTDHELEMPIPPQEESVLELTRDSFEPSQQKPAEQGQGGGVDWNFGSDNLSHPDTDTASMTGEEDNKDSDDDDMTVEMEPATHAKTVAEFSEEDDDEDEEPKDTCAKDSEEQEDAETRTRNETAAPEASHEDSASNPAEETTTTAPNDEESAASPTLRRSRRSPKKRVLAKEEAEEEEPSKEAPKEEEPSNKKDNQKNKKNKKKKQPNHDQLLQSTDYLFVHADKDDVTVADMYRSLEAEFDCKLSKSTRKVVKAHLISLMTNQVEPSITATDATTPTTAATTATTSDVATAGAAPEDVEEDDEHVSDQGDEEEEEDPVSDQGDVEESEASEYEQDEDDDGDQEERPTKKNNAASKAKLAAAKRSKTAKTTKKPKRPSQRKAAKAARLVEGMRLRKKRMEALRIRNEEMQLNQTKEDQERAEMIAAKLDTNTDQLRMKRLEHRLDLLTKLDLKRIHVLEDAAKAEETKTETEETKPKEEETPSPPVDSESDESSDEEDLVIVGATKKFKPLEPLQNHVKASALDILDRIRSPDRKRHLQKQQKQSSHSPNRSTRFALRQALKQKQRSVGNKWLARELGYKTEQEHLQDCQAVAKQKRVLTMQREHDRVKANERKQLRERILLLQDEPEDQEAIQEGPDEQVEEEEDEELQMAKEIEQEQSNNPNDSDKDGSSQDKENQEPINTPKDKNVPKGGELDKEQTVTTTTSDEPVMDGEESVPVTKEEEEPQDSSNDFFASESPSWETQPPPGDAPAMAFPVAREVTMDAESSDGQPVSQDSSTTTTNEEEQEVSSKEMALSDDKEEEETCSPKSSTEETKDDPGSAENLKDSDDDEEEELEFEEETTEEPKSNQPRNAAWQAMLQKEEEKLKQQKKRKGGRGLVEQEAEEEEEEEVAGLEDFGFSIKKKNNGDDEEEDPDSFKLDEDDLKHVVDDISDDEGDEEAGRQARKTLEKREEKEKHKQMLRRMREGYDGRRGGIAGSGVGARGIHRFDQLVAADNREDAKRLGLLNEDELDSDDEDGEKKKNNNADDDDDEGALLDKVLKDRFLHRSNVDLESFSDDEVEDQDEEQINENGAKDTTEAEEERTQERLAKRFAKRARMCRLEEMYADSQEFSQQKLIDEDGTMKQELKQMKNGLVRKRSVSSSRSSFSSIGPSSGPSLKRQRSGGTRASFGGSFLDRSDSLSLALRASRSRTKHKTSFLGGQTAGDGKEQGGALIHKSVALSHVVFRADSSRTSFSNSASSASTGKRKQGAASSSFFRSVAGKNQ